MTGPWRGSCVSRFGCDDRRSERRVEEYRVMSMSVSASNNALAYLQQLLQSGSGGVGATSTDPLLALGQTLTGAEGASQPQSGTSPMGSGSAPTFASGTLAALISLQGQSASAVVGQSPSDLFSQLDTDGDGQISKTEF